MTEFVRVYALLAAKEGRAEELKTLLRGMTFPSRAEEGNLRYDLWQDADDPGRFVLEELYRDQEAAAAHKESPHFRSYLSQINALAARTAIRVIALDVESPG